MGINTDVYCTSALCVPLKKVGRTASISYVVSSEFLFSVIISIPKHKQWLHQVGRRRCTSPSGPQIPHLLFAAAVYLHNDAIISFKVNFTEILSALLLFGPCQTYAISWKRPTMSCCFDKTQRVRFQVKTPRYLGCYAVSISRGLLLLLGPGQLISASVLNTCRLHRYRTIIVFERSQKYYQYF